MKRKFIIFLLILSLIIFIFSVVSTYAKYKSEYLKTTNAYFTKWNIKINNKDISNNLDLTSVLTYNQISNPHIANNIIAPTSQGYFDLEIDCSDADLSFTYTIDLKTEDSPVQDYRVTGYSLNNGTTVPLANTDLPLTNDILVEDNIDTISYRFFLEWYDHDDNITNNNKDTEFAINQEIATIKVNVSFEQIVNTYNF